MSEESFGVWLKDRIKQWKDKQYKRTGKEHTQADFARAAGVPTTSLSTWITNIRLPVGENIDKLADVLGPQVYDKLNAPRKMPRNKLLIYLAEHLVNITPETERYLYQIAKEKIEQRDNADDNETRTQQA